MTVTSRAIPNTYQDSVKLMRAASDAVDRFGLDEALAVMATDENKSMVLDAGLADPGDLDELGPNDLLLAVDAADAETAADAIEAMADTIRGTQSRPLADDEATVQPPRSLQSALGGLPDANLALISVPGEYAAREAWKALHAGLHVHIFSDNVDLDDEQALKAFGREADRLVMGPDCGTAIINGVPLGFANAVDEGAIGVVAAAGTGLQEVTSLVDRGGAGISQAIGTGGRDLAAAIGGQTMQQGLSRLADDPATEVIVLVSKPPAPETLPALLDAVAACQKPVVVSFVGSDTADIEAAGAVPAATLAAAARAAIRSRPGSEGEPVSFADGVSAFTEPTAAETVASGLGDAEPERTDVRGLFTGGTFAVEAVTLLEETLDVVGSNVAAGAAIDDPLAPAGHAVVDLGADAFTRGRPHPMIDPAIRTDQLETALADESVLVVLLDVVLGYGAHDDPAGPIAEALADAGTHGWPAVVASVCGTRGDPQGWDQQVSRLVDDGAYVAETNADAARLAGGLWAAARDGGATQ